jgi:hypothetical protein
MTVEGDPGMGPFIPEGSGFLGKIFTDWIETAMGSAVKEILYMKTE